MNEKKLTNPADSEAIVSAFSRTTDDMFSLQEFREKLATGRQLRIKYGVDVTAPELHIGHAVNLWMLRKMQDFGHKVIFLIGDFTTRIGDPTGKSKTRPVLAREDIERNIKRFVDQVQGILRFDDPSLIEVRRNSEWFEKMPVSEFMGILSGISHAHLVSRDMFQKRIHDGDAIHMHEMLYPVLQGYDSVMLESDLTIIGSDQLFNEMLGRALQERSGQKPQTIITTKITPGIDGREKQSKSLGNYVGLGHAPREKFGRLMSLPDGLMEQYFRVYTDLPEGEISAMFPSGAPADPMVCKKRLAWEVVLRYHGREVADAELSWFEDVFSGRQAPADAPAVRIAPGQYPILSVLVACCGDSKTKSDLRRLVAQGAVSIDGNRVLEPNSVVEFRGGEALKIGRRAWFRISCS